MLDQIPILQIRNGDERLMFPNTNAKETAVQLWEMCEWLFEEFIKDATNLNTKNVDPMDNPSIFREDKELNRFRMRVHCRFLSYSVIICSIDRILEKMYADLCAYFQITRDNNELNNRISETENLRLWRDKIAAHTSYSDPHSDNEALQLTSLIQFSGMSWQNNPIDFRKMHFGGMAAYVNGQPPNERLPLIQWDETHEKMKEHYQQWTTMFSIVLSNYQV